MITQPYTVPADSLLEAAAPALTARGLTRVPVVDASGRLVGILSERAIVSALVAPLGQDNGGLGETLRRSARAGGAEPLTASALTDRDVPRSPEATEAWRGTGGADFRAGSYPRAHRIIAFAAGHGSAPGQRERDPRKGDRVRTPRTRLLRHDADQLKPPIGCGPAAERDPALATRRRAHPGLTSLTPAH